MQDRLLALALPVPTDEFTMVFYPRGIRSTLSTTLVACFFAIGLPGFCRLSSHYVISDVGALQSTSKKIDSRRTVFTWAETKWLTTFKHMATDFRHILHFIPCSKCFTGNISSWPWSLLDPTYILW